VCVCDTTDTTDFPYISLPAVHPADRPGGGNEGARARSFLLLFALNSGIKLSLCV